MSGKLNTKDIKTGGTPKLLQPGNVICKINKVALKPFTFKPGGYDLILSLEGPDLGSGFEGFLIDTSDESKGRHKGQVGQVKAGEYAFADGETKTGVPVSRDAEILKFMKNLCTALGILNWLDAQDNKHDTIELLIEAFNNEKPFADKTTEYCIGGKEYLNKGGYMNHELFLVKSNKIGVAFGNSKVLQFNPAEHIRKKKVENVSEFGGTSDDDSLGGTTTDFSMD